MSDESEQAARQPTRSRRADGRLTGAHADRREDPAELPSNRRVATDEAERDEHDENGSECRCEATFHGDQLIVDAESCPGGGRLASEPGCRETVIGALSVRDATAVCTRVDDTERACGADAAGLLLAAGRFVDLCDAHDPALTVRVRRDPLAGARLAAGRSDFPARLAAETGLLEGALRFENYYEAFGDRDTYRVRGSRHDADGRADCRPGERTDRGPSRIERTTRALDDGASEEGYRRHGDGSASSSRFPDERPPDLN